MLLQSFLAPCQIRHSLLKARPSSTLLTRCSYTTQAPELPKEIIEAVEIKAAPPPPKVSRIHAFQVYVQDKLPLLPSSLKSHGEGFSIISKEWKELPEEERKKYIEMAFRKREESKRKVVEYKKKYSSLEIAKYELESKKEAYEKEKLAYQALIKKAFPRQSGYTLFASEFSSSNSNSSSCPSDDHAPLKEFAKKASQAWKNLSQEEKEKYKKRAKELNETRASELEK